MLAEADLSGMGSLVPDRSPARRGARAVDGAVDFRVERTLDDFIGRWTALPGIGPWTAQYVAMRALGHPDAFPDGDLVLQKAVPDDGSRLSARALAGRAEAWRPWRAYAAIQLWRDAIAPTGAAARTPRATRRTR